MRWGGFCGEEIGGPLDVFDPLNEKWESFQVELERQAGSKTSEKEPPKRSVHVLVPFAVKGDKQPLLKANGVEKEVVGVLGLGEGVGAPKELGHDGAGKVSHMTRQTEDFVSRLTFCDLLQHHHSSCRISTLFSAMLLPKIRLTPGSQSKQPLLDLVVRKPEAG